MDKHETYIRRGRTEIHRDQAIVERFNRTLAQAPVWPLINVRYLYQPGELEGGTKRATDPIWSLKVYQVVENKTKPNHLAWSYFQRPGACCVLFV